VPVFFQVACEPYQHDLGTNAGEGIASLDQALPCIGLHADDVIAALDVYVRRPKLGISVGDEFASDCFHRHFVENYRPRARLVAR
jgi:hypothetical protein